MEVFSMSKTVIRGATVIDTFSEKPDPQKKDILLEDEKIKDLLEPGTKIDAEEIQAEGLWIIPGLIDLHFHPFLVGIDPSVPRHMHTIARNVFLAKIALEEWLNSGVTTVRSGGSHENLDIEVKEMLSKGDLKGPRMFAAGSLLAMDGGLRQGNENIAKEFSGSDEAREVARKQIKEGVDQLKIYAASSIGGGGGRLIGPSGWNQLNIEEINAIVDEGKKAGVPSFAHTGNAESVKNCVKAGVQCVEHATELDDEAVELLEKNDVPIVPTLTIGWSLATFGEERGFGKHIAQMAQKQQQIGYNSVLKAKKAGVRVGTGTDADSTKCLLREECRLLVEKTGFTPYEALQSATKIAAEILLNEGQLGCLQKGAMADLVILEGDPLEDINNLKKVKGVFQSGEKVWWRG